jgi:glycosyltransferase involved in cell wall biosynthesis
MKFSIVTPAFNSEKWIRETIESVLTQQGNFEIEYFIIDGGSKDATFEIAEEYRKQLESGTFPIICNHITMKCFSESDKGMYDAINKGFAKVTGDMYAWINADDIYAPHAFQAVTDCLTEYPEIDWLKGLSGYIDANSKHIRDGKLLIHHKDWIEKGIYGKESYFIEQDSMFWRNNLWKKITSIPTDYSAAGDYFLWMQFAKWSPLISFDAHISFFRKHAGQKSKDVKVYRSEQNKARSQGSLSAWIARLFFSLQSRVVRLFPKTECFFLWLYHHTYMQIKPEVYLSKVNGHYAKKKAYSYIA